MGGSYFLSFIVIHLFVEVGLDTNLGHLPSFLAGLRTSGEPILLTLPAPLPRFTFIAHSATHPDPEKPETLISHAEKQYCCRLAGI